MSYNFIKYFLKVNCIDIKLNWYYFRFILIKTIGSFLFKMIIIIIKKNQACSYLEELRLYLEKEKTIYFTLNKFKLKNSIFHG